MSIFLQNLTIKNYKCFEDQSFEFGVPDGTPGSGLNFLIGENGNGKTTVLEAINYLTQNTYSSENKLSIRDFRDYENTISITAETEQKFRCKSSIGYYSKWHFEVSGIEFNAKSRSSKQRGKLLSNCFEINNNFTIASQYKKEDGSDAKDVDSRDKSFSNSAILEDEINIFYFDKNRTRQITAGNYKTTFEKICDDLNWRFVKNMDETKKAEIIESICSAYFENVLDTAQKGVGGALANDLAGFFDQEEYKKLKIELLDLLHPFSSSFFALRNNNKLQQVAVKDLGSGVEMILTLLLLKMISGESKGNIIYLIDEPELHLHPKAQEKFVDLLLKESKDKQIFVSTHSPYIFQKAMKQSAHLMVFKRDEENSVQITNTNGEDWKLLPWSPSWGQVNYFAYNLATEEFHDELYGYIHQQFIETASTKDEAKNRSFIGSFDQYLQSSDGGDIKELRSWTREKGWDAMNEQSVTLPTFIRNKTHHPENKTMQDTSYSTEELKASIEILVDLLSNK